MPKIMLKNTTETKSETNNTLSLTKPIEKTKTTVDTLTLQRNIEKKAFTKIYGSYGKVLMQVDMFITKKKLMNLSIS